MAHWEIILLFTIFVLIMIPVLSETGKATEGAEVCNALSGCSEDLIEKVDSGLLEWFASNGGIIDGVEMRWSTPVERSLIASRDIPKGTEVLTIPLGLVVDTRRAADTLLGQALLEAAPQRDVVTRDLDGLLLAIWLLQERGLEESTWAEYLASLPQRFPKSPLNLTEEELQLCVSGLPSMSTRLRSIRQYLEEEWKVVEELAANRTIAVARDDFLWARFVSFSRTFTASRMHLSFDLTMAGGPRKRLPQLEYYASAAELSDGKSSKDEASVFAPVADMINHASGKIVNCGWEYRSQKGFVIITKQSLVRGQELFISYGNKPNDIFLSHYGFVEFGSPYDVVDIVLPLPVLHPDLGAETIGLPLKIDAAKPANIDVIKAVLDASRKLAKNNTSSAPSNTKGELHEKLSLEILFTLFQDESNKYQSHQFCPLACVEFRESRQALLATWIGFLKAALSFLSDSWPPAGLALPERLELHSRLYFGIWLGTLGKEAVSGSSKLEAMSYGEVSYLDFFDLDYMDE